MRTLTLIRHAKSSWKDATLQDFERPLNARGQRNAPLMGRVLKQQGVVFDLLVTSPARRALETAHLIAAAMNLPKARLNQEARLYDASVNQLMDVIHRLPETAHDVALVGHNPGITDLCNHLSAAGVDNLPTCAVARIAFALDNWEAVWRDSGRLVRYEYPRKYPD